MHDLQVITQQGKSVIDSRQVAEFVDKQHAHLLRDIDGYVEILAQSNFGFTESKGRGAVTKSAGRGWNNGLIENTRIKTRFLGKEICSES